jgi:hypothetical protein
MAFLTIAGVTYQVQTQSAVQNESQYSGERVRSFANTLLSSRDVTTKKRQWQFALAPMTQAASDALVAAIDGDVVVTITGDAVGGVVVSSMVSITQNAFVPDGLGFLRAPTIMVDEV